MIDIQKDLAVQSYCFRNFKDNAQVADMVRQCGLDAIELCGVHVNWAQTETFASVIDTYRKAGVRIVSIGVNGFADNEGYERTFFEFVQAAGAKHISCDFKLESVPAAYRTAERLADEYDVRLGIHNHGGRHWLGCAQMLNHVFEQTSPRIGLCIDTAWALHSHENPLAMIERFAPRLTGLHLKDFTFGPDGGHKDVVVGTGNLDLPAMHTLLKKIDFNGLAIIEYEADPENPVPALTNCAKAIREKMQ